MYRIMNEQRISVARLVYMGIAVVTALAGSYFCTYLPEGVWLRGPGLVCTAYSVLAGFFLAVLTMSGTFDTALGTLSASALKMYWMTFSGRLLRQACGCGFCLVTVTLAVILESAAETCLEGWLRRAFLFMTICTLFWALSLPRELYIFYRDRYEYMIEQRSREERK